MDNESKDLEIITTTEGSEVDLPPIGELNRRPPEVGTSVYVLRPNLLKNALKGIVSSIKEENSEEMYEVKIYGQKKKRTVSAKMLAYTIPASVIIPEGIRVIARYTDSSGNSDLYAGIVAEPPKTKNRKRYLIFFDDGYAQYVNHEDIYVVCKQSIDVADDVHSRISDFVRKYLEKYPEYPMKKLTVGHCIKVEKNFEWFDGKVLEVDCSMVKIQFLQNPEEPEWIHRGSGRFRKVNSNDRPEQDIVLDSSPEIPNPVPSEISSEPQINAPSDESTSELVRDTGIEEGDDDELMDFDSIDIDFDE